MDEDKIIKANKRIDNIMFYVGVATAILTLYGAYLRIQANKLEQR